MEENHFNCRIRMYIHPKGKKGLADAKDIILSLLDDYDLGHFCYMKSHESVQRSKNKSLIGSYPIEIGSNTTYENILKFRDELKENERITLKGFDFIKEPPKIKASEPEKTLEPKPPADIEAMVPPKPVAEAPKDPGYDISFEGYKPCGTIFGKKCKLEGIGEGNLHWEMELAGLDASVLLFYVKDVCKRLKPKSLRFHYLGDEVSHTFDLLSEERPDMDHAVKTSRKIKGRIIRGEMKRYIENLMKSKLKK